MSESIFNQIVDEKKTKVSAFKKQKIRKKIIRRVLSITAWVISAVLLFLCANNVYQQFINRDKYLGFFGTGYAVVESPSMTPTLNVNDMIMYKEAILSELSAGDIVIYKRPKTDGTEDLIVHRLVAIKDGYAITKGDANAQEDEPFDQHNIIGKFTNSIGGIGLIIKFLASPAASFSLIALIIAVTVLRIWLYLKARKKLLNSISDNEDSKEAIITFFDI